MSSNRQEDPTCISDIEMVNDENNIGLLEAVQSFSEIYENDLELLLDAFETSLEVSTQYYILDCCICYRLIINNIMEGVSPSKRKINQLLFNNLIKSWNQFCLLLEQETEL